MCVYNPDSYTTRKSCQMTGFKEGFVLKKINTETKKRRCCSSCQKELGVYMGSGEATGNIFLPCFWEEI